jgi:hypothetical protein
MIETVITGDWKSLIQPLASVTVFGVFEKPQSVYVGKTAIEFEYDIDTKKLKILNSISERDGNEWALGDWKLVWSTDKSCPVVMENKPKNTRIWGNILLEFSRFLFL